MVVMRAYTQCSHPYSVLIPIIIGSLYEVIIIAHVQYQPITNYLENNNYAPDIALIIVLVNKK